MSVKIVFLSKQIFPECPQSKTLGSNIGKECESEADMRWTWPFTFTCPDVFLRVIKAEQHGLVKQSDLFEESLGNELGKKSLFLT